MTMQQKYLRRYEEKYAKLQIKNVIPVNKLCDDYYFLA